MKIDYKLILKSILAGICIGVAGILFIYAKFYLGFLGSIIGSILFSSGLLLICFFKLTLFTGKVGLAFTSKTNYIKALAWLFIMLLGNLFGATLIGLLFSNTITDINLLMFIQNIGNSKVLLYSLDNILKVFLDSSYCGILVYIAVYLFNYFKKDYQKILGIVFPVTLFVYSGFYHCIANMFYFIAAGICFNNILPMMVISIIGNSLGALVINKLILMIKNK